MMLIRIHTYQLYTISDVVVVRSDFSCGTPNYSFPGTGDRIFSSHVTTMGKCDERIYLIPTIIVSKS